MDDDDDEVVFENSPLYQHLQDVGFTTEDVQPEKVLLPQANAGSKSRKNPQKQMSFIENCKKQLIDYVFDESWQEEVRHLCHKSTAQMIEDAMKNSALREDDAAYVESFADSLRSEKSEEQSDTIMGQMLTQVGVLGVTIGYGFLRMFYMKSPDLSSCFFFYALDILSIIMTVVALLPATIKFAMAGRLVGRLQCLSDATASLVTDVHGLQRLMRRAKVFIHEAELVKRGFTMVAAPISRLESGLHAVSQRQCPALRRAIFCSARKLTLDFREATIKLFNSPSKLVSSVGLGDESSYLSNSAFGDYGRYMTDEDDENLEGLTVLTDNYSLDALKSMVEMLEVHVSEFIRVLVLLCLIQSSDYLTSIRGFSEQLESVQWLSRQLKENQRPLHNAYVLHKQLETRLTEIDTRETKTTTRRTLSKSSPAKTLRLAVHSLWLHLLSAAQRLQPTDEQLESVCDASDKEVLACDLSDLRMSLISDLKAVGQDLAACRDCFEELSVILSRLNSKADKTAENKEVVNDNTAAEDTAGTKLNVSIIPDCDPEQEDQVFEGYPDDAGDSSTKNALQMPEEEEKMNRREAVHVLAELKTVIAVRAEETQRREEAAILKMGSDFHPTVADDVVNDGTNENKVSNGIQLRRQEEESDSCIATAEDGSEVTASDSGMVSGNEKSNEDCHLPTTSQKNSESNNSHLKFFHGTESKTADDDLTEPGAADDRGLDGVRDSDAEQSCLLIDDLNTAVGPFSSAIARLAAAKSHQMATFNVETFGSSSSDDDDDDDELPVNEPSQ